MPRKTVVKTRCALCGAKDVSEPRGEERYCRDCWEKKIAVEEMAARELALNGNIRGQNPEKYLTNNPTINRPFAKFIALDDGNNLFLPMVFNPNSAGAE